MTAVALDDRGEFGALGDRHTDTLVNDIIDLITAVVIDQPPVDPEGRCTARADYVSRDDYPVAIASAAAGFEGFAAKIGEPSRVDECDIVLEKFYERLLFVVPGAPSIAAKNKSGYTDPVEIIVEQLSEPRPPHHGIGFVVEQLDRSAP